MSGIKFIHTADLHLDTPFKGLAALNPELTKKLKDATFASFRRIIDLCIDRDVDFLVISGDIFDNENKSLSAQLKFSSELRRLSEKGKPTYIVCGNHDPYDSWLETFKLPENIYRFNSVKCEYYTFEKEGNALADIHGISFKDSSTTQNLALKYKLSSEPSLFSIAVLHGTLGHSGPHAEYAPFSIDDIIGKGFDYWALGHIHKQRIIRYSNPSVVYPGNPQGRDFGETGLKGCYFVELKKEMEPELEFIPTQLIQLENIEIDLTGAERIDEVESLVRDVLNNLAEEGNQSNMILRMFFKGRTTLHPYLQKQDEINRLKEYFNEGQLTLDRFVWIDSIIVVTRPNIDIDTIKRGTGFPSEILKTIDEYKDAEEKLKLLIKSVEDEFGNVSVRKILGELEDHNFKEILFKAQNILIDKLFQ